MRVHLRGLLKGLMVLLLRLYLLRVAADLHVISQQDVEQVVQPLDSLGNAECSPSPCVIFLCGEVFFFFTQAHLLGVALVHVYQCDLLQRQLLQLHAVVEDVLPGVRRVQYVLHINDVLVVIHANLPAERVFHGHGKDV